VEGSEVSAPVLDPRAATAAAIARSQMPYDPYLDRTSPHPRAVKDLARNRFGIELTDSETAAAIEAAMA
jgi:hypothetical protein